MDIRKRRDWTADWNFRKSESPPCPSSPSVADPCDDDVSLILTPAMEDVLRVREIRKSMEVRSLFLSSILQQSPPPISSPSWLLLSGKRPLFHAVVQSDRRRGGRGGRSGCAAPDGPHHRIHCRRRRRRRRWRRRRRLPGGRIDWGEAKTKVCKKTKNWGVLGWGISLKQRIEKERFEFGEVFIRTKVHKQAWPNTFVW